MVNTNINCIDAIARLNTFSLAPKTPHRAIHDTEKSVFVAIFLTFNFLFFQFYHMHTRTVLCLTISKAINERQKRFVSIYCNNKIFHK